MRRRWKLNGIAVIVVSSLLIFYNSNWAFSESSRADQIRNKILSLSAQEDYHGDELINTLFEIEKQKLSDSELIEVYIGLLDYYIGEGPGEILSQKITAMGDKILPFLVEKMYMQLHCDKKFKELCRENREERNDRITRLIGNIKKGIIFYPEFPASLTTEHERDLKIIKIFILDFKNKNSKLPDTLDNLREYAWHEYGYKLRIYSPWFGKLIKYAPQKDGKYILEAGDDKP